ncbi:MAG: TetR/AcrR family transcriptional regulator [Lachnospiraceae bacterium]|nr:TetR/AcrR family transcriptional regulator [Lachnospiraceae bacterium]
MKKKTVKAEATKHDITKAALELFFEKGYENTSIRMITSKVGLEVGSFYYHFASKDEVMEAAIDLFFSSYEEQMRLIVNTDSENSRGMLTRS